MKKRTCLFMIVLAIWMPAWASNVDSLKQELVNLPQDSNRVLLQIKIARDLQRENPNQADSLYNLALKLSQDLKYDKGIRKAYKGKGWMNVYAGDYTNALTNFLERVKICEKNQNIKGMADGYLDIGVVYYYLQNKKTVTYWQKSIDEYSKLEDTNMVATIYRNMAGYFKTVDQNDSALVYANKSLKVFKQLNSESNIAATLINIGNIYLNFYHNESVGLTKQQRRLCEKALASYSEALKYETVMSKADLGKVYNNIGETYNLLEKFEDAGEYVLRSLDIHRELADKEGIKSCFINLASIRKRQRRFEESIMYSDSATRLEEQLRNIAAEEALAEMETKYQTEKKEQENKLLKKDNELQKAKAEQEEANAERARAMSFAMGGGVLMMFVVAGLIFYQFREKKKANKLLNEQNDEIKSQNEEILSQRDQIENQNKQLAKKNMHILSSIEYARRIQEAILPSDELIIGNLPESFVYYQPKDIVSGDFYWMEVIDSKVFWAAVDCTGHGVPGAFMSILGANGLKKVVVERKIYKPSEILQHLTDHVVNSITATKEGEEVKDGMDIALCCWDKETNILEYSGAYNPLYLIRDNEIIETKATKRPVGRFKRKKLPDFVNHTFELQKDDCIYIFSDGFADQFGGDEGMKYTYRRMRSKLIEIHKEPMEDQHGILMNEFLQWKGKQEQLDDICIFGVRV